MFLEILVLHFIKETNTFYWYFQEITVIQRFDFPINILFFLEPAFTENLVKLHKIKVYIIKILIKRKKLGNIKTGKFHSHSLKWYSWSRLMKFLNYCIFSLAFIVISKTEVFWSSSCLNALVPRVKYLQRFWTAKVHKKMRKDLLFVTPSHLFMDLTVQNL